MMDRQLLQDTIDAKYHPVYMKTASEAIEYYKEKYGQKKWTRAIAEDLYGTIKDKKGKDASVKSIQRRFQGDRLAKEEGKSGPIYEQLGRKLPPLRRELQGNRLKLVVTAVQENGGRERSWTATWSGADAYAFANDPSYYRFFRKLNYAPHVIDQFDGDDSSALVVTEVT